MFSQQKLGFYLKKGLALLGKADKKLVAVHECANLGEANIAKGLLESNGIPAFIFQNNRAEGLSMIYSIRLMVASFDKEEALKLLSHSRGLGKTVTGAQDK